MSKILPRSLDTIWFKQLIICVINASMFQVFVILSVLIYVSHAQDKHNDRKNPCDIFVQDGNNLTLNCSRRNIDRIPGWPEKIENLGNEGTYRHLYFVKYIFE